MHKIWTNWIKIETISFKNKKKCLEGSKSYKKSYKITDEELKIGFCDEQV